MAIIERRIIWLALICALFPVPLYADDNPKTCAAMSDADKRLLCYDGIFRVKRTAATSMSARMNGKWNVRREVSRIDDSSTVVLSIKSDDNFLGKYGAEKHASMIIRCMENTTSIYFKFGDHFLADIQGYGALTYRLDDRKPGKKSLDVSTDNEALGLWAGGSSIPFIKQMLGTESLVVRVTPFNESSITATFDIRGIDEAVQPVREACSW